MATDRITIIRGRTQGRYDWFSYRRGQSTPLDTGRVDPREEETLPEALTGKRAGATTIALPASQVVTRIMTLPLHDPEELAGAVDLQVDKFSPFPVEQMVYSYEVLEQNEDETAVLIVISQRASVAGWGDDLRATGVQVHRVDCVALGTWKALQTIGALDTTRRQSMLIIDEDEVVLMTHDSGRLLSISGLGDPGDFHEVDVCEELAEEVSRILMETDADNGMGENPELVLFAWEGHGDISVLRDTLSASSDFSVVMGDVKMAPDIVSGLLQRSLAPANGAQSPLNLIPEDWVRDSEALRFRKHLIAIGGGLLGLWLLLLAGGWGYLSWEQVRLDQMREREQEWLRPANAVRSMRLQVNLIDRYRDRTHSALESLREVSALLPQGIDLVSLTYRTGDGLEIVGEADSGSLVLQFNQSLNESALFNDVRPGTRTRTRQGRHRFSFEITFGEVAE